jgi:hypothetical protein
MTVKETSQSMHPRRWFAIIWATPVFFAALSAGIQLFHGGAFDAAWTSRTLLIMSVPLVMADRMAMLNSVRVRQIMGRWYRYFMATTYASFYGVLMILVNHDSSFDQIAVRATVFVFGAVVFGAAMSRLPSSYTVRTTDLADRYLDLDTLEDGNWYQRTSHLWWAPFAAALWLTLIWTDRAADDLTYIWFQLFLLLAALPALPTRPSLRLNPFLLSRLVASIVAVGVGLVAYWIS